MLIALTVLSMHVRVFAGWGDGRNIRH